MTAPGLGALRNARLAAGVFILAVWLGGCAVLAPQATSLEERWPGGLPERVELSDVPFFPQRDYQCGPAALATVLAYGGAGVTADDLVKEVYLPGREGSLQIEMLAAARRHGLVSYELAPRFEDLLREVAAGNPVIVLQDYGVWPISIWHYAVVVGYDHPKSELTLRSGEKKRLVMPFDVFEYVWKDSDYWSMVAVPPQRIPATATESRYLAAILALDHVGNAPATGAAYRTFLARWPDDLTAAIGLANSEYAQKDLAGAEATLREAAARHPGSVAALNNLAQVLSDEGRNDEALALVERALALGGPYAAEVRKTRDLIVQRRREASR